MKQTTEMQRVILAIFEAIENEECIAEAKQWIAKGTEITKIEIEASADGYADLICVEVPHGE